MSLSRREGEGAFMFFMSQVLGLLVARRWRTGRSSYDMIEIGWVEDGTVCFFSCVTAIFPYSIFFYDHETATRRQQALYWRQSYGAWYVPYIERRGGGCFDTTGDGDEEGPTVRRKADLKMIYHNMCGEETSIVCTCVFLFCFNKSTTSYTCYLTLFLANCLFFVVRVATKQAWWPENSVVKHTHFTMPCTWVRFCQQNPETTYSCYQYIAFR